MYDGVSLNLVVIYSADLEAAQRFYECLGVSFQREQHGKGPMHLAAELADVVFEIYPLPQNGTRGASRIGFRVANVDNAVDALRQQSAKVLTEPRDSEWGRRAVVEDFDGYKIELTERQ